MLAVVGAVLTYGVLRAQRFLPGNPDRLAGLSPGLSFNTSISFVTNTDWQNYVGESEISQFGQMFALTGGSGDSRERGGHRGHGPGGRVGHHR